MNKKNILKKTAAMILGATLTVAATGCNFVLTDNEKDLAQTIAKVDITAKMAENMTTEEAKKISSILKILPSDVSKRDLVANFLSYGYQNVQTYGYEYVFNSLLDGLVNREIMIQYAVAHYLQTGAEKGITAENCTNYAQAQLAALQDKIDALTDDTEAKEKLTREKVLLEKHPEVLTLKYFLTNGGDEKALDDYNYTVYTLRQSFNNSLDTLEEEYVKVEEKDHDHAAAQTLPSGITTQKEKYYPVTATGELDYNVYTGRNLRGDCGKYEAIDGSSPATRQRAYNDFLANLQSYNLVQSKGGEVENTKDATLLDYYYVELASSLGQALINKYFEDLENTVLSVLDEDYAIRKYEKLISDQKLAYEKDATAFATALDSESATSMTLYGLDNFGFVYNILLPFSATQEEVYADAKADGLTQDQLFNVRKSLLADVVGKDQRAGWINEHEDENYATKKGDKFYFFQDIINDETEFEKLEHYLGVVPFNGSAELKEGKYEYQWADVSVDTVLNEFLNTVKAVIPTATISEASAADITYDKNNSKTEYVNPQTKEVDYNKFVYRKGQIKFGAESDSLNTNGEIILDNYFVPGTDLYKLVSVANEMMFAYSTDTGCLNSYMGYAVSPYSTNFMKEFEFAAQQAVADGVGAYYVAPTDYGWHIIITTFAFNGGQVYGEYNHDDAVGEKMVKGSFSNIFYEYLQSDSITTYKNQIQTKVQNDYNNKKCVKLYKSRYQDLLDM